MGLLFMILLSTCGLLHSQQVGPVRPEQVSEIKSIPFLASPYLYEQGIGLGLMPGVFHRLGLGAAGGLHVASLHQGAFKGVDATGHGFDGNHRFNQHELHKNFGGGGYGQNGGYGAYFGTKGGFGNQFVNGNANVFSKEKVFSQNKNFGSGIKSGFGHGFGSQGGLHNLGSFKGYGGFGGFSGYGNGAYGSGGYGAAGIGSGVYGAHGNHLTSNSGTVGSVNGGLGPSITGGYGR